LGGRFFVRRLRTPAGRETAVENVRPALIQALLPGPGLKKAA
jgi:hypothetical protein